MKGLTLTQPWATLVAIGAKSIETRGWATNYRGPLAIHAAKGLRPVGGERGLFELCKEDTFLQALGAGGFAYHDTLPRGAIVAVCDLEATYYTDSLLYIPKNIPDTCADIRAIIDQERAFGDYTPGRYAWLLANVRSLAKPVPCRGALSLWDLPPDVLAAVQAQIAEQVER